MCDKYMQATMTKKNDASQPVANKVNDHIYSTTRVLLSTGHQDLPTNAHKREANISRVTQSESLV